MHWIKPCTEGVKMLTVMLLEVWGLQGIWRCLLCAFYILCKLSFVSTSYIHETVTTWKSLSSATACDLSCLLLLAGPAFLCRGVLEPLFLPPISVWHFKIQVLGDQKWFHCNVSLEEGSHLFRGNSPTRSQSYSPFSGRYLTPHLSFLYLAFLCARGA